MRREGGRRGVREGGREGGSKGGREGGSDGDTIVDMRKDPNISRGGIEYASAGSRRVREASNSTE